MRRASGAFGVSIIAMASTLASCATTIALDSPDATYAQGLDSFRAGNCKEARERLLAFDRRACLRPDAGSGCQRAAWMQAECAWKEGRPGASLIAAQGGLRFGPPRPELNPPLTAMVARAHAALDAAWASPDRSGKLTTTFVDETSTPLRLTSVVISLDLHPGERPDLPARGGAAPVMDLELPPGNHLLIVVARFDADMPLGRYKIVVKSAQSFSVKAQESVRIKVRIYLVARGPLTAPPDLVAVDFQVTPESAKP